MCFYFESVYSVVCAVWCRWGLSTPSKAWKRGIRRAHCWFERDCDTPASSHSEPTRPSFTSSGFSDSLHFLWTTDGDPRGRWLLCVYLAQGLPPSLARDILWDVAHTHTYTHLQVRPHKHCWGTMCSSRLSREGLKHTRWWKPSKMWH